jgi:hypothetical protein
LVARFRFPLKCCRLPHHQITNAMMNDSTSTRTSRSATTRNYNSTSAATQEIINLDDENNNCTDSSTLLKIWNGPTSTKSHKTSSLWGYFSHLHPSVHPEMKLKRCCLICHEDGRNKVISVGNDYSPMPLVQNLRTRPEKFSRVSSKKKRNRIHRVNLRKVK